MTRFDALRQREKRLVAETVVPLRIRTRNP